MTKCWSSNLTWILSNQIHHFIQLFSPGAHGLSMDFPLRITENSLSLGAALGVPRKATKNSCRCETRLSVSSFADLPKLLPRSAGKKKGRNGKIQVKSWGKYKNEFYEIVHDMASMSLKIREMGRFLIRKQTWIIVGPVYLHMSKHFWSKGFLLCVLNFIGAWMIV